MTMKIQEIAQLANVSPSTVSRVFANHKNVRPEIREKVFALARANGYHPRLTVKQKNIVIITPYNSVYPVQSCVDMILMALMQALPERGYRLEILPVNNLERLHSIQFCSAIAIGCDESDFPGWDESFASPLILMDRNVKKKRQGIYTVRSNEKQGMEMALDFLLKRNCRKIGVLIHGEAGKGNSDARYEAVVSFLKAKGHPTEKRVYFTGTDSSRYVELTGKLLKEGIDALFCPGGNAGITVLYALSLFGKKVPEDISLIASEQTFFSQYGVPPQTTLSPDYRLLAGETAELIGRILEGEKVPKDIVLDCNLIVRESVK